MLWLSKKWLVERGRSRRYKLQLMHSFGALRFSTVVCFVLVTGCTGEKESAAVDTAAGPTSAAARPIVPSPATGWERNRNGPVLLYSGPGGSTLVVLPGLTDSTLSTLDAFALDSLSGKAVELFGRPGLIGSAELLVASQAATNDGCLSWPGGTLSPAPKKTWRIGLSRGVASAVALDSLESMTPADSSMITSEIARMSSSVAEGSDPAFRGLPFAVTHAYRFAFGKTLVLIAEVVRRINEEANPRVEHLLLVAERTIDAGANYEVAFESRIAGAEDVVRTSEVLAVVLLKNGTPVIITAFEYEEGNRLVLLERRGKKQWKIAWRSAYTGC